MPNTSLTQAIKAAETAWREADREARLKLQTWNQLKDQANQQHATQRR